VRECMQLSSSCLSHPSLHAQSGQSLTCTLNVRFRSQMLWSSSATELGSQVPGAQRAAKHHKPHEQLEREVSVQRRGR
jgi:hypothetical protein